MHKLQIVATVENKIMVVGVLSLAPCYVGKRQVRGVDQTPYPSQLHGASLATAMQRPCRPLQI